MVTATNSTSIINCNKNKRVPYLSSISKRNFIEVNNKRIRLIYTFAMKINNSDIKDILITNNAPTMMKINCIWYNAETEGNSLPIGLDKANILVIGGSDI